jgi:polyadenylate-binding protein
MPGMPNYPYMAQMAQGGRMLNPGQAGMPMRYGQPALARQPFPMRPTMPMGGPRGAAAGMPGARPGMPPQYMPMPGMNVQQPRMMMPQVSARAPASNQQQAPNGNFNQQQAGFKYNQQARNAPGDYDQTMMHQQPAQAQQPPQNDTNSNELTAEALASAPAAEQKQMLGERIYPLVSEQIGAEQSGKVTGMLLEIENTELLMLIDNKEMLKDRIKEACDVLASHQATGDNHDD